MRTEMNILFDRPVIPPNTGNAIRLCAATGATLHLAGPLGFDLQEKNLRRAGLDYHDLADVELHDSIWNALDSLVAPTDDFPDPAHVYAFTTKGTQRYSDIGYQPGDILLFGPEPTGLEDAVLSDPRVTSQVRIPMLDARRSLNLSNCAAIANYEMWKQFGFTGGH